MIDGSSTVLVVSNVDDDVWAFHDYGALIGGESGTWMEISNSQAAACGGIGATGNPGERIAVTDGKPFINHPS